ncbi:flagellar biosynthesis protein [Clostridium sp. 2-1]|uniref:FliH/SctL family protein n=1 Tax=Clostridium TaxID=1485 RepID=UPI000CDA93EA|nr:MULTISPECIES: FliH/SctL family protein [Clostridium]MBN7573045.1 flagellar biosynthesis protein [Clostridium beijerinckii]MBN7578384.1 flagellar biosynthesis protein [Clostridium beijerinckii]MBN7582819.1 flagellar biosynthesis protein [Clostridium beijerinckii]MBO0518984.1 flagellar biosynthesis protein [Clostridium beijerinckii]POO93249.1 flagellar biosynthesis protein [Clostridium sp. 2-1]
MQSSYRLIKKDFAKSGTSKVISTEYISKKAVSEEIEEEKEEEEIVVKAPQIDPEELLKRYEDIGQRIIQDAKNEKQIIVLRAQMDANASEKKAYEKGYAQGLENGYDDGYKKAYDETIESARAEAADIVNKAELMLKSAHENYERYLESKKNEIVKLALEIAENITKKTLSTNEAMNNIIEEAFKISKGEENVILKVNSTHVEELKLQVERWKVSYNIKNEIFVLADDFMEPGNAVLEKNSGIVKVGVDIGMEQMRKAIFG